MKHGFFKVAAASPDITVADCSANAQEMIKVAESAHKDGVRMLVFPELSITGYTCADLFYSEVLIESANAALSDYLENAKIGDMISIIGLPLFVNDKIYNCAAFCQNKQILGIVPKANISNYGEYYESRHFAEFTGDTMIIDLCGNAVPFGNNLIFCCSDMPKLKIGIEICEDLWVAIPPSSSLAMAGATVIANPAASSEVVGKEDFRRMLVTSQSARAICGYVFANAYKGESTTDSVFSGHSIIAEDGNIIAERKPFDNSNKKYIISEIDLQRISHERRRINTHNTSCSDDFCFIDFSLKEETATLSRNISASQQRSVRILIK